MTSVCDDIVFITNSQMENVEYEKLDQLCNKIYTRKNVGYDFSMWKYAFQNYDYLAYDEVVLVNSSVVGPVFPIEDLFCQMEACVSDFWGVTENYEEDRHVQSYFLVFRKSILNSNAFRMFWDSILEYENKWQVIRSYEIGMTQWFLENGFSFNVYCPTEKIFQNYNIIKLKGFKKPKNPTICFGKELLELKVPFLKLAYLNSATEKDIAYMSRYGMVRENLTNCSIKHGQDLEETNNRCPVCESFGDIVFKKLNDKLIPYSKKIWNIKKCKNKSCGCFWTDPVPSEKQRSELSQVRYSNSEISNDELFGVSPKLGRFKSCLLFIGERCLEFLNITEKRKSLYIHGLVGIKPGKVLEIGCGNGSRLSVLKGMGWEVAGQEIRPSAVKRGLDICGIDIHYGDINNLELQGSSYDVILMSHVLEHVNDPLQVLKTVRHLLKPCGELRLATSNAESLGRRIYGKNWFIFDPTRNVTLHTHQSLNTLLKNSGFSSFTIDANSMNAEYAVLRSIEINKFGWTSIGFSCSVGKNIFTMLFQIVAILFTHFFKKFGEELIVVAKK
jgi:2-polyprenyl-3-methyl-5-hydroxy-6-metoxy-1,4-benzoquinol methylase